MWLWDKNSVEYEIFKQYERALVAIGVDLLHDDVQDALESCSYGLEDAFKAAISYVIWLHEQEREYNASAILVCALSEQWKPRGWHNEYLNLPILQSQGQKFWVGAAQIWGYDRRNQLVADIVYERGKEYIVFTNGKEMLIDTAWQWGWERVLTYAISK
ncbi:hypothetical protein [Calothrix sp. PCC 7507]|uniref:hypothetical protein n=1 Tax=Calothrix sp. PCC 7507 TaxID=99598 RepID=UPI00029F1CC4|nr:hypothetical protein [Calothrix sp. PCC 7507]AFY31752.1 hypothetical protein Cal7507_1281 [Calothrix sp. PCC 7507]